ncbi:MAG: glycoside hydrolase family 2 TIM barrel-domain containing protein, partial [Bacilli bacterium]
TDPFLYDIKIFNDDEVIYQKVGIRSIKIENGIFLINGVHQLLKGVNRHETNPYTGNYVTVEDTYKDLKLIKSCYVNAIRTSHYPNIPEFYELCNVLGLYVMDEADLETHGVTTSKGGYDLKLWKEFTENGLYDYSVTQREISLYERDKNYTCVIIFSLGNESSFGPMFFDGIKYLKSHDDRPIHYEGIFNIKEFDEDLYYTKDIDIVSRMYPDYDWLVNDYLKDKRETRPLVLCEYSHAMGNSVGDIKDYFDIFVSSPRFMGGFVWEWCDHGIIKDGKILYGGEFNEPIHDGNFCVDGLVTVFREFKSNTLEMIEIYKGNNKKEKLKTLLKPLKNYGHYDKIDEIYKINNHDGEIKEINFNGNNLLVKPISVNFLRAKIDNENFKVNDIDLIKNSERKVISYKRKDNVISYDVLLINNGVSLINYKIKYSLFNEYVDINLKYKILKENLYVQKAGLYFALNKNNSEFTYYGFGPYESYIDKHHYDHLDEFSVQVKSNLSNNLKPQDSGERYYCSYLKLKDIEVNATKSFSLNVLPYDYQYIEDTKHNYDLVEANETYVSLDIFASGVGSNSCGPDLKEKYKTPSKGHNTFRIKFIDEEMK